MKNGAPESAVIMPTGASPEPIITLATASHIIRKEAPTMAEVGRRTRWSGPITTLVRWGITKPTKTIKPLMETAAAVMRAPEISNIHFTFSISTPKC